LQGISFKNHCFFHWQPFTSETKNSAHLIKKLSNSHIPDDCFLASFDVVSLFTNVPIHSVIDIIKENWSHIEAHTNLPCNEFIFATKFVLESTYFNFNNRVYKQTYGVPMGSPLSPIVADLFLQRLESLILSELTNKPIFYYRYVDDIVLSLPHFQLYS